MKITAALALIIMSSYLGLIDKAGNLLSDYFVQVPEVASVAEVPIWREPETGTFTSFSAILDQLILSDETVTEATSTSPELAETVEEKDTSAPTQNLADAIVNIYCEGETKKYSFTASGSGFFINNQGVILTNAHVAQFLLIQQMKDFGDSSCYVRTGVNAKDTYTVSLLYISPTWILENANSLTGNTHTGSGMNDFALLYVNEASQKFPFLETNTTDLDTSLYGQTVILAGYPTPEKQEEDSVRKVATTTIAKLTAFSKERKVDVFTLDGSEIGAEGASGGPVIDYNGKVIGVISTRANDETYGAGSLRAISLSYINRSIKAETGFNLSETINGDLVKREAVFKETLMPFLIKILETKI